MVKMNGFHFAFLSMLKFNILTVKSGDSSLFCSLLQLLLLSFEHGYKMFLRLLKSCEEKKMKLLFIFTTFILLSSSSSLDCKKFIHNANKLFEIGNTHAMNEDYDKAIECFQLATEVNPDFTLAFKRLARIYANHRKDASKANQFFEKVFSLEPKDLETHLLKANVHKKNRIFYFFTEQKIQQKSFICRTKRKK